MSADVPSKEAVKYTIKEYADGSHEMSRYGEFMGMPNNAELQFWQQWQAAETSVAPLRARIAEVESQLVESKAKEQRVANSISKAIDEYTTLRTAANQAARALEKLDRIYCSELDEVPPKPQWLVDAFAALRAAGVTGEEAK